jgi:hypothetical protein
VMQAHTRAWHRHRGGVLVEMREVFPLTDGQASLVGTSADEGSRS